MPNSAIKTIASKWSVQVPSATQTQSQVGDTVTLTTTAESVPVVLGSTDNTMTSIESGLSEGDKIYARQVYGATPKASGGLFGGPPR